MTTSRTATYDLRIDHALGTFGTFSIVQVEADSPAAAQAIGVADYPQAQRVTVLCARFAPDALYLGGIRMLAS
jgi:hypothetical protein